MWCASCSVRRPLVALLALVAAGCGGAEPDATPDVPGFDASFVDTLSNTDTGPLPPPPLSAQRTQWNPAATPTGQVTALTELGNTLVLSSELGTLTFVGGALVGMSTEVRSAVAAATVPAGDAAGGQWMVLVDAMGRIWRVRDRGALEDVTGRYGLGMRGLRSVAAMNMTVTAFGGPQGFALANGMRVLVWNDAAFSALVAGGGRVAALTREGVKVFDPMTQRFLLYTLDGVSGVALSAAGRLVVTAGRSLYVEDASGTLIEAAAATDRLGGVVRAGDRYWLLAGAQLASFDGTRLRVATDLTLSQQTRLIGSPTGDVWALSGGMVARYAVIDSPDERLWEEAVRPVYARRCVPCHLPGGTGNLDLSSYAAWVRNRANARVQVLDRGAMPPNPPPLSQDDRTSLARWLTASPMTDAAVDATVDASLDAGVDVPRDTGPLDVPRDTGPLDVPRDTGPLDVPRDTGPVDTGVRDTGVRDTGPVDTGVRDAGSAFAPTFAIFQSACVRCHGASGSLDLSTETLAYNNLVGIAARGTACTGGNRVRVVRGNAAMSLLYQKLDGTHTCGNLMPRGAAALSAAQLTTIRTWINNGANR